MINVTESLFRFNVIVENRTSIRISIYNLDPTSLVVMADQVLSKSVIKVCFG